MRISDHHFTFSGPLKTHVELDGVHVGYVAWLFGGEKRRGEEQANVNVIFNQWNMRLGSPFNPEFSPVQPRTSL